MPTSGPRSSGALRRPGCRCPPICGRPRLGRQISPVLDHQAVGELVKVAGDQGRLGGLLKLWLVDQPGRGAPEIEVRRLLDRLGDLQGTLADIVARV